MRITLLVSKLLMQVLFWANASANVRMKQIKKITFFIDQYF
jgi:hypothetical protein